MDQIESQTGNAIPANSSQGGPLSMLNPTVDPNTATVVDSTANPASTNLEALFALPAQSTSAVSPVTSANNSNPSTAVLNTTATNGLNI